MIGGNTKAIVQILDKSTVNSIGETVPAWINVESITGWLDFSGGESKYKTYNSKIEESTHIFICDYKNLENLYFLLDSAGEKITDSDDIAVRTDTGADEADTSTVNSENARLIVAGKKYDVVYVDDPMNLHRQFEIYLKFTGGDANVRF